MTWPVPQPGLVIRYSYLWESEARAGREEGVKDRPCAIVLMLLREGAAQTAKADGDANGGKPDPQAGAKLTDLVQNDRSNADLGDFQMILVTVIAALVFVISAFEFLAG